MTREELKEIIETGRPFTIHMADGKSYPVLHRDYIGCPPLRTFATVYTDGLKSYGLPYHLMAGVTFEEVEVGRA